MVLPLIWPWSFTPSFFKIAIYALLLGGVLISATNLLLLRFRWGFFQCDFAAAVQGSIRLNYCVQKCEREPAEPPGSIGCHGINDMLLPYEKTEETLMPLWHAVLVISYKMPLFLWGCERIWVVLSLICDFVGAALWNLKSRLKFKLLKYSDLGAVSWQQKRKHLLSVSILFCYQDLFNSARND